MIFEIEQTVCGDLAKRYPFLPLEKKKSRSGEYYEIEINTLEELIEVIDKVFDSDKDTYREGLIVGRNQYKRSEKEYYIEIYNFYRE